MSKVLKRRLQLKKIKKAIISSNFWKFFYISFFKHKLNLNDYNKSPYLEF